MVLRPDLRTFRVLPFAGTNGSSKGGNGADWLDGSTDRVGRLICDIYHPDGTPFEGCPRLALQRITEEAKAMGFTMMAGPEAEFFLFQRGANGPTTESHDSGELLRPHSRRPG